MSASFPLARRLTAVVLPVLCLALADPSAAAPDETPAPAPRAVAAKRMAAAELDQAIFDEAGKKSELMKNLEYLCDVIGPRVTGSRQLKRANEWAAEKMKEYGLENVKLEPWEIPIAWERGTATMRIVEPDTRTQLTVASLAWAPGLKTGKVTGPVVHIKSFRKDDLAKYKGKLKNAVVLTGSPSRVAPVSDPAYGPLPPPPPKKKDDKKAAAVPGTTGTGFAAGRAEWQFGSDFFKAEGVACVVVDSGKPHGLLMMYGGWNSGDRAAQLDRLPYLTMAHEHYAMLYRLANREGLTTKVELEITNSYSDGPVEVFNTIGEIRGSEKPDEVVVVGAHLDSWDLGSGATDNGTGSCVVLETARVVAALAKAGQRPKRTIRFCLFTGEEQGLYGSRDYVKKHKDEMPKTSVALVHDTGTGRVTGFGLHNREMARRVLEPELAYLETMKGWVGLDLGGVFGSDHQSFHGSGVPGFACRQDIDEYRLTHHTQTDTFDKAKGPNLVQGAQVMAITAVRVANLSELLPRTVGIPKKKSDDEPKKDEPKKPTSEEKKP